MHKVKKIGPREFLECTALTNINLPYVEQIQDQAFDSCDLISHIELPSTLSSIGNKCFYSTSLTSLILNSRPSYIGPSAFNFGNDPNDATVSANWYEDQVSGYPWGADLNKVTFLFKPILDYVYVPDDEFKDLQSLKYYAFTSTLGVGSASFKNAGLTGVTAPILSSVGVSSFENCKDLSSVSLPSATTIANSCFRGCTSLIEADLPNVRTMCSSCFRDCINLKNVNLSETSLLGEYCFYNCGSLSNVHVEDARC